MSDDPQAGESCPFCGGRGSTDHIDRGEGGRPLGGIFGIMCIYCSGTGKREDCDWFIEGLRRSLDTSMNQGQASQAGTE